MSVKGTRVFKYPTRARTVSITNILHVSTGTVRYRMSLQVRYRIKLIQYIGLKDDSHWLYDVYAHACRSIHPFWRASVMPDETPKLTVLHPTVHAVLVLVLVRVLVEYRNRVALPVINHKSSSLRW